MTTVVATLGSLGDVHPFLAVARHLRELGEEVVFLSQEPHRGEVEAQGLHFEAIVSSHDHDRTMRHPDLWHPIRGFGVLWRHLAVPAIGPTLAALQKLQEASAQSLTVFASPLVVGARLAREVMDFRLVTGHTAPAGLRSCEDPMFIAGRRMPAWLPQAMRRHIWRLLDRAKLEPMARPALTRWRHQLGLPPLEEPVFARWLHSPDQVIGLFPADFGPMPTDWPVPVIPTGFPLYEDATGERGISPELGPFIDECCDQPLLVVYPGSTATNQAMAMLNAANSLAAAGVRSVLIGDVFGHASLAQGVHRVRRTQFPPLLRRAHCFVHHGGVGALAQGLAAGVGQVILPSGYDQFDNAWRLQRMQRTTVLASARNLPQLVLQTLAKLRPEVPTATAYSRPGTPNLATRTIGDLILHQA